MSNEHLVRMDISAFRTLTWREDFLYWDGALISLLRDTITNTPWLLTWIDKATQSGEEYQRWLALESNDAALKELLEDKITMYDFIMNHKDGACVIDTDYPSGEYFCYAFKPEDEWFKDDILPEKGYYLNASTFRD